MSRIANKQRHNSAHPLLGWLMPDSVGTVLGTGYLRFESPTGIDGLVKIKDGGNRMDLLAVIAKHPGTGEFREFLRRAKLEFKTICVWEIWNNNFFDTLLRYGFTEEVEISETGETVKGVRWDKAK